jgi:GDP-L-fucose synthase
MNTSGIHHSARIYVAGHTGLVGSAITRALRLAGYSNLVFGTLPDLDLTDQGQANRFFDAYRPEYVVLAAAKVGGILANNTYPADFIEQNLAIELNVIRQAYRVGVRRMLFLGSSCIYPRDCPQPIREEYLLTGPLEPTNRPYALAKIAGIEMCWAYNRQHGTEYLAVMPTNLYGLGDNYDLHTSHVIPALIRKTVEAKEQGSPAVTVWGTGRPRREFLYSQDLANACLFLLELPDKQFSSLIGKEQPPLINIGFGEDLTIRELAELIADVVGFEGDLVFDSTKPDGAQRKLLDISKLTAFGWAPSVSLREGIEIVCNAYRNRDTLNKHCF